MRLKNGFGHLHEYPWCDMQPEWQNCEKPPSQPGKLEPMVTEVDQDRSVTTCQTKCDETWVMMNQMNLSHSQHLEPERLHELQDWEYCT